MSQKLVIIRGAACSGKTTVCKKLRDYNRKIAWVSIDNFKKIFSDFEDRALDDVNEEAVVTVKHLFDKGFSVVIDGIFKNPRHYEEVVQTAKNKSISTTLYQLECSLETLKKRDRERDGVKQGLWPALGDEIIESLYRKVEENPIKGAIRLNTEELSVDEIVDKIRKSFNN